MNDNEIYEKVEEFVKNDLNGIPFDKGLPQLQEFVWDLGKKFNMTGPEVLMIYFSIKSKK